MALMVYSVTIEVVRGLRPVIEKIARRDSGLADQLRRAATSVPLNVSEGAYVQGGNSRTRFHTALGSAAEVRACLDVAEALGYIESVDAATRDKIDRIIATLHKLTKR